MPEQLSWLCPTPNHRERLLDMQNRLRLARAVTIACCGALMLSLAPRFGWPIVALGGPMVLIVLAGGRRLEHRRRPELWVFASTVLNLQLTITAGAI